MPDGRSLLLGLPAELRNLIYEMVLEHHKVKLSNTTTKRGIATGSALQRVNKQVRDELVSVVWLLADIHAYVNDLNFAPIVTFLNDFFEAELRAMPTISLPAKRKIIVELRISDYCRKQLRRYAQGESDALPYKFERWLKRTEHPAKTGTNIILDYKLQIKKARLDLSGWVTFQEAECSTMADGKRKEGLKRVLAAVSKGTAGTF